MIFFRNLISLLYLCWHSRWHLTISRMLFSPQLNPSGPSGSLVNTNGKYLDHFVVKTIQKGSPQMIILASVTNEVFGVWLFQGLNSYSISDAYYSLSSNTHMTAPTSNEHFVFNLINRTRVEYGTHLILYFKYGHKFRQLKFTPLALNDTYIPSLPHV